METRLRAALDDPAAWGCDASDAQELLDQEQVHGRALTAAELVAQALSGQRLASAVLVQGTKVLGWALAQATTLMAPERIVIGGGVSLAGEPLRQLLEESWKTYVFPPMREQCDLVIGQLGEQVVLHGATQLAMASV
jgi:glucokinase